ncbi:c-type cytochrome [Magnetospirillum sp. SS-4]|uniref:c-type cytochrome n=1 Tax=Magnetospirillum sp. SS-4 TaxID=2681465 RepID=UPI00138626BE|nr:c-type cytochrome [Magnetospirillum sp. SS-4]CAA7612463.1 Cytochrome c553 [Magnetospirillum sp. SS-4]
MKRSLAAIPAILGLAILAAPAEAGPINVMADACSGCHGTDGQSVGAMPGFDAKAADAKSAAELKKLLRDYRSGAREATVMGRIAKGYTEAQLDAIVDHFKK